MKVADISLAKDPDLRASITALQRAAELARKAAIQTGTSLVVIESPDHPPATTSRAVNVIRSRPGVPRFSSSRLRGVVAIARDEPRSPHAALSRTVNPNPFD